MQKVLIPIGYHPVSEKIAKAGCDLASRLNAQACLLHVVNNIPNYGMEYDSFLGFEGFPAGVNMEVEAEVERVAQEFLKKATENVSGKVKTHIAKGETAFCILEYAKAWGADLIVMGTHSHSVLQKIFMGAEAIKVLENTKIPVYMVPVKKK